MDIIETKRFVLSRNEILAALINTYPAIAAARSSEFVMILETPHVNMPVVASCDLSITFEGKKDA